MRSYRQAWLVLALVSTRLVAGEAPSQLGAGWTDLFNGKNLDGWYSFLQKSGKNNDTRHIFRVERGMIHILGLPTDGAAPEFGYLATEREFSHCRIRAEYRWGTKRFEPVADGMRDSGLIYYKVGSDDFLARALQLQIMETNTGDLWINGGASVTTSIESEKPPTYSESFVPHRQDSGTRIAKSGDFEDRDGWNTVEVILDGDRVTHIVNGRVVLRAWSIRQPDPDHPSKMIPLDHGQVLLEEEGAEIWFRSVQIKPLPPKLPGATRRENGPLALDMSFGELLTDNRSRPLIEALLSRDVLDNPLMDSLDGTSGRDVLTYLLKLDDQQLQAIDRIFSAMSSR
jgi:hypothetical protein